MTDDITALSRYLLPILALVILGLCLFALLKRKPQSLGNVRIINQITGDIFPITARETSLGRSKDCDIVLNYPGISRYQAVIICKKDGWYVNTVGGSEAVLKVNGKAVEKTSLLADGNEISCGGVKLRFLVK